VHSDLWGLAGTLVKNGDLATTNDIKVKSYSLYNTDVNLVDLFPVENTFIASGSSSKTLLLGSIKEQVFKNGSDITLRHNNILATNINWALSEANDNVNALCIKGNDGILLHQGASSVGGSMKILNSKSGKIELLIGNAGTQASCLTGLTVDWNSGQPQTIVGTKAGLQNIQQTKSKLLVQQSETAGEVGIEIVKNGSSPANAPLNRTTISDNNVDTHSLTLKTNFTGTTTKALYLDASDNLRYNGNLVTPVQNIVAGSYISIQNNNGVYTISRDSNNILAASLSLLTNYTGGQQRTLYLDAGDNLRYAGNLVTPVKNIVAGSNISVTNDGNGNFTIARSSDNVTVNTLVLAQSNYTGETTKRLYLDAGDNLRYAGNLVTPVKDIVAGAHISVTNNNGVYTIARTGGGGSVVDVGEDLVISATAVQLPRKSFWYGLSFVRFNPISRQFYDVHMSANGKYIYFATRAVDGTPSTILSTANYGNDGFFVQSNVSKLWIAICGTTEGNRVFACGSNEIWANTTPGTTWTQSTTPPDFAAAMVVQFKCNGDGKYQLITDARANSLGAIYKSNDYGATWTQQNITGPLFALPSRALGCCVNASGKTQYVVCDGTNNLQNAENGAGGLYRSQDYGATWARVIAAPNGNHQRVACDATGRYIGLVGSGLLYTSKDYGATWMSHNISSTRSIWVSQGGDYMWVGILSATNNFYFSTDHGHTFTQGNTAPDGSYQGMANDCIACNNDGSIVVAGSISGLRINTFREFPNDVRQLVNSPTINAIELGQGVYKMELVQTPGNYQTLYYVHSASVSSGAGYTFTPTTPIDLRYYNVSLKINMLMDDTAASGYTFYAAAINGNTGSFDHRMMWKLLQWNQYAGDNSPVNLYPQQYTSPSFVYLPAISAQSVLCEYEISFANTSATFNEAHISQHFRTSVGVIAGGFVVTSGLSYQSFNGVICSAVKNNNPAFQSLYIYPAGNVSRNYSIKVEMWIRKRDF
jgi:photosystem II stability/assembly factor-like uncharacterized protein